ncbi:DUF4344 domain-containing metallopeptidase [Nocardia sp. CA-129566]|uniref:DUF4344 domain-containing metallopeptidase n=1 Tax=Nocardia sp. CA-129566 TaxID=3239976 RepID=UPI003D95975F
MLAAATAACSSNKDEKPAASGATSAVTTSQVADTGKFVVRYDRAMASDLAKDGKKIAQDNKVIDDLAEALGNVYKLPKDVTVVGKECGEFNAYWDPQKQSIVLCYEMFGIAEKFAKAQAEDDLTLFNVYFDGITRMITLHESAHMAINLYSLPTTGREEDAADQLGALILLTAPGVGGLGGLGAASDFWFAVSDDPASLDARSYADQHSLSQVRAYNLLCWLYGAVPDKLGMLVQQPGQPEEKGLLPSQRAVGCPDEYNRMRASWETLLKPYIKIELGLPTTATATTSARATPSATTTPTR